MVRWVVFLFFVSLAACSSSSKGEPYDHFAGRTFTYECKNHTGPCYHMADARCKKGYSVVNTVETEKTGGLWGRYRVYAMTIRCNK